MLLAVSKPSVLSTAFLIAVACAATASAQVAKIAQHNDIDQAIVNQPQTFVEVQAVDGQVVNNCGYNTGYTNSNNGLTLCDIVHGCAFKRDTANLWDGYCQENKSHCDNGCSPLFKGRMGCGMHGGINGGCNNCRLSAGAHGCNSSNGCNSCNAGFGKNVNASHGLLGSGHCGGCNGNCNGACQGKTTTTTLPVISAKSGCAAGCAAQN